MSIDGFPLPNTRVDAAQHALYSLKMDAVKMDAVLPFSNKP